MRAIGQGGDGAALALPSLDGTLSGADNVATRTDPNRVTLVTGNCAGQSNLLARPAGPAYF